MPVGRDERAREFQALEAVLWRPWSKIALYERFSERPREGRGGGG